MARPETPAPMTATFERIAGNDPGRADPEQAPYAARVSVRRAVIPAAGRGTRMLPVSRTTPKELLPLGDTPVIDIVVRELLAAGLDELVVVTGPAKGAILEHLGETGVPVQAVAQPEPRGLGDAVLQAAPVIGREPFAVALPDALIPDGAVRELIAAVEAGADGAM